jgi:hypothetical protein
MLTARDMLAITATGALAYSGAAVLQGFGVLLKPQYVGAVPIAVGLIVVMIRAYVAFRGADSTQADEALDVAEDAVIDAAGKVVRK